MALGVVSTALSLAMPTHLQPFQGLQGEADDLAMAIIERPGLDVVMFPRVSAGRGASPCLGMFRKPVHWASMS